MSVTHQHILEEIRRAFPKDAKLSVLDYGCGNGELARIIPPECVQNYQGWEVSDNCLAQAKKIFFQKKYSFHKINTQQLPHFTTNKFDVISLIGVVQYMEEHEINTVFKQMQSALKNDGILLISTTTDHLIYKLLNIYQYFLPHRYITRSQLIKTLQKHGFAVKSQYERGILFAPVFSDIISFFFDAADRFLLNTRGELGFFGKNIRLLFYPLLALEQSLPIDFGLTLFISAKKQK